MNCRIVCEVCRPFDCPTLTASLQAYESSAGDSAEQSKEAFRAQVVSAADSCLCFLSRQSNVCWMLIVCRPSFPLQTGVLERRLFYMPSFKIYGSVAGFYDYGPPGCAVKQYITQFWRQHFVLEEDMLQVLHSISLHLCCHSRTRTYIGRRPTVLCCVSIAAS